MATTGVRGKCILTTWEGRKWNGKKMFQSQILSLQTLHLQRQID